MPDFALTIAANATAGTATFTLTPTNDTLVEGVETLSVVARGALPATGAVLALADDDGTASTAVLGAWPATVREGSGATSVTVTAVPDGAPASERVLTVSVSPVSPASFALGAQRELTIAAGRTASTNTATVTATADAVDAPDQVVTVSATVAGGHGAAAPVPRLLTVADDEPASTSIALSLAPASVTENGGAARGDGDRNAGRRGPAGGHLGDGVGWRAR